MHPTKACPVVVREGESGDEILVFRHPLAGVQLVKGTIESGESAAAAAVRELAEESGVSAKCGTSLGVWDSGYEGQVWAFFEMEAELALPSGWQHHAAADGGHDFRFFWHSLSEPPGHDWHPLFADALEFIKKHRGNVSGRTTWA